MGKNMRNFVCLIGLLLGVSACSYDIGYFIELKSKAEIKSELTRWEQVEIVDLTIKNNQFSPMVFRVEAGRPYVLKMLNLDNRTHSFRSSSFFDTIHYELLHDKGRYFKTRYITSLELEPNVVKEYYFIPAKPNNNEAQRFEFDSANYFVAIPPAHMSFYGQNTINGTYGVVIVEPEGTLCSRSGGGKNCQSTKN